MFKDKDAIAMIAVKDIQRARVFYQETLGLQVTTTAESQVVRCHGGETEFLIYVSEYAGTNKANALAWAVGDEIEDMVAVLKAKGVAFEHYDRLPNTTRAGDVHVSGTVKLAWFKDPDGNVLHLIGK